MAQIPYLLEYIGEMGAADLVNMELESCYHHYPSGQGITSVIAVWPIEEAERLVNGGEFRWYGPKPV